MTHLASSFGYHYALHKFIIFFCIQEYSFPKRVHLWMDGKGNLNWLFIASSFFHITNGKNLHNILCPHYLNRMQQGFYESTGGWKRLLEMQDTNLAKTGYDALIRIGRSVSLTFNWT